MILALLLCVRSAPAQTLTSSTLSGVVHDDQGSTIAGVTVVAVHEPTGTTYETLTGADGRFQLPQVRAGGPYTVKAALAGFKEQVEAGVSVELGDEKTLDFRLPIATLSDTVTLVAQSMFSETRAGTASNVHQEVLEALPTLTRSLVDFAKISPYFNELNNNGGDSFLSVAGRNNRYDNILIDGAINNDVFGLAASGTPGGQTGTQPISLDAVQELQLVVAPYDVRQGGFSGGSINLVTRSGSNTFSGTGYFFRRDDSLVSKIPATFSADTTTKVGRFSDQEAGVSAGGAISKNRAFYFGNVDFGRRNTPSGFSIDGSTGQAFGHRADIDRLAGLLKNQYNYDPGGVDEFSRRGNSEKIFARADVTLSAANQLTIRNNYVSGLADQSGTTPSARVYIMPGNFYRLTDKLTSTVVQLNTRLARRYNELRVTYQRERSRSDPAGHLFPDVQVDLADGSSVRLGSDRASHANSLDQDIIELTDDFTWLRGGHTITLGTHNEFFKFSSVFIDSLYGQYRFASLESLAAGVAGEFNHTFSNNASDPLNPARFSVRQLGVYAGDVWRARPTLTLTFGVRFDAPEFPDTPHANALADSTYGYRTDAMPAPRMFSPRGGFNWGLSGSSGSRSQLRGGAGIFAGRPPYVWVANQFSNTGVNFTTLSTGAFSPGKQIPFAPDPLAQPISAPGAAAGNQTINLIDPEYQYPSVVRGNLALDHEFGFLGLVGTGEVLFGKNLSEIKYQNLNYVSAGTRVDGRPIYARRLASVNDVILLTNTDHGGQWSVSYKINRPFRNGAFFDGSYLYGRADSVIDGTSSVAASNFFGLYQAGDINNPPLAISDFNIRHRISFAATIPIALWHDLRSHASFYYNGQSGRPYSIVFSTDVNLDGRANDLLFVPATQDQVLLTNGTWAQLDAFLNNDSATKDFRGQIAPRNTGRAPWTNNLNFRYGIDIPTAGRTKIEATMDIFNLLNLINKEKGWVFYPNSGGPTIIGATVGADGKYTYNLNTITAPNFLAQGTLWGVPGTFTRDDLRSRWQMQWGLRIRF